MPVQLHGQKFISSLAVLALVAGCNSNPPLINPTTTVASYPLAGSLHVAVLSTAPWNEVVEKLQPAFAMTPALALASVNPVTATLSDRAFNGQTFGLNLALASSGKDFKETLTSESSNSVGNESEGKVSANDVLESRSALNAGVIANSQDAKSSRTSAIEEVASTKQGKTTTTLSESTRFRTSAKAEDAKVTGLADLTAKNAPSASDKTSPLGTNPELQYAAAKSLYTSIQVSNMSLLKAVNRLGYTAQFAEIQISLLPRMRNLPYDAYVNLGFFANKIDDELKEKLRNSKGDKEINAAKDALVRTAVKPLARTPIAIPILATDNLETTSNIRNLEALRQINIGLTGVVNGFGLGAKAENLNDRVQALQGNQINSLLTTGRVTDNSVRVRIGAMNQGIAGQLMVARTHNIALLLLVPSSTDRVSIAAEADFIDPSTNLTLPSEEYQDRRNRLSSIGKKYPEFCLADSKGDALPKLRLLDTYAFIGNRDEFDKLLWGAVPDTIDTLLSQKQKVEKIHSGNANDTEFQKCYAPPDYSHYPLPPEPNALMAYQRRKSEYVWLDLVSLIPGSRFNSTGFDIEPVYAPANLCPIQQTVPLFDDGDNLRATFRSASEIDAKNLDAVLTVKQCDLTLPAVALEVQEDGQTITGTFLSLSRLKMPKSCNAAETKIKIEGCEVANNRPGEYRTLYVPSDIPEKTPVKASRLQLTSTHLTNEGGNASVDLFIEKGDAKRIFLRVSGADIVDISNPQAISRGVQGYEILTDAAVSLKLRNLSSGKSVNFWLTDEKGKILYQSKSISITNPPRQNTALAPNVGP